MAASETAAAQVVQETAEVILVEVPVHVTTREGQPVRGLTAADFELLDRGQKRSLSGLDVVDLEALPEGSAQGPAAAGRRRFLLCFDVAFSRPESLLEARRAARDFVLEGLHASDLAAVMILTLQKGPEFLVSFTSDRAQLVRAIESLGAPRRLGPARIDDPLRLLIEAPKAGPALGTQSLLGEESPRNDARNAEVLAHLRALDRQFERGRRSIERGRVSDWTHALEQLATALASLGGSKRLLYFSEGADAQLVPAAPAEAAAAEAVRESLEIERGERWLRDASDVQGETSLRRQLRTVIRSFQRAGVPVDAIDIGGLSTAPGEGRRQRRTVLSTLARGTGGDLYDGTNDLSRLLGRVLSSTTVTYVLRFQPTDVVPDGSFHVLQVRLKQQMRLTPSRDLIVTHRQGYYAPRPFAALHPLEKSLLAGEAVITAEPRQDLAVDLLVAPFRAGPEGYYLPVILEIDGADLLREPPGAA
ncbi:MAG: VWA domain-containing protein, partial [Acidobacteriota bacterium]